MAKGKFQIKSRAWNIATAVVSVVLAVVGFGGLFIIQRSLEPTGTTALLFVVFLGVVTLLLFAGPGIVYSARKRIPFLKKKLPGGTMVWIRSHLYLPILALVAAFVHATVAPFRGNLSSGKVTLVLGVLVAVSGLCRHHVIGLQKEALNLNVAITKLSAGQPRAFQGLITDLVEDRRPLADIEVDAGRLDEGQRAKWAEAKRLSDQLEKHFPRTGGQRSHVRHLKVWKAVHPPLTVLLFAMLAFHVWDVFGGKQAVFGDDKTAFASASQCGSCHSDVFADWATSSMAHAQNGTITKAQLPVTLGENRRLAEKLGAVQKQIFESAAKVCINCHAPVGSRFAKNNDALLPFGEEGTAGVGTEGAAVKGGGTAVQSDGVGCISCHTQSEPLAERAGFGLIPIDTGGAADYGTQFGPLFSDPRPLPVREHGIERGKSGFWDDPIITSRMCGACHNVKADIEGDGINPRNLPEDDFTDTKDSDGDLQLDQNELDRGPDGALQDLVLQTTFDEWQDYVAGFSTAFEDDDQVTQRPLGCTECHMPTSGNGKQAVVDHAPGFLPIPERPYRSHSFVGVDYDLDPKQYQKKGMRKDSLKRVLEERQALLQSAVTLEVVDKGTHEGVFNADVVVRNNRLGHAFPTGFAFARQFWLEVSARTESGEEVCLQEPLEGVPSSCASGVLEKPDEDLRQCDPREVAKAAGLDPAKIGNSDIGFAAAFPADKCDPWLTNFQKILTDGDPDGDGTAQEVSYQAFLADVVKLRTRVADQQVMAPLESVRTDPDDNGEKQDLTAKSFVYRFDASRVPSGEKIIVTAKMRFRHLPPDFIRDLDRRQEDFDVPDGAKIEAAKLIGNLVITDVVEARSGAGPVLACKGPQNEERASIFDCVKSEGGKRSAASSMPAGHPSGKNTSEGSLFARAERRWWPAWIFLGLAVPLAVRVRRHRGVPSRPGR